MFIPCYDNLGDSAVHSSADQEYTVEEYETFPHNVFKGNSNLLRGSDNLISIYWHYNYATFLHNVKDTLEECSHVYFFPGILSIKDVLVSV